MTKFEWVKLHLQSHPGKWLVTGCAGFIGSNLIETLLSLDQEVVGLDNFSTGHQHNLDDVRAIVGERQWQRFSFIEGDIRDSNACNNAVAGVDFVLHQAALGSVPRSIDNTVATNDSNVTGFLNMLLAARDARVKSFVYAASSSTYGDHPGLPKVEQYIGKPLSPYALTKYVNELYADVFFRCYGFRAIGLRYFNVFGKRQDPDGAYAAVIPKWVGAMLGGGQASINGDGSTSRDFCYIENAVQANLLASMASVTEGSSIYNVAVNDATTLNQLFAHLHAILHAHGVTVANQPVYTAFRHGDVLHSKADISKAMRELGYTPEYRIRDGLDATVPWYIDQYRRTQAGWTSADAVHMNAAARDTGRAGTRAMVSGEF